MTKAPVSRRDFLKGVGGYGGSAWLATRMPLLLATGQAACTAKEQDASFRNLSAAEARELVAIAEVILPATDTPGATDTGVIYFIDEALGGFMAGAREFLLQGLADLQAAHGGSFAALEPAAQTATLKAIEQEPFFQLVRMLTVSGMFCMPGRGGNRDHQGWRLLNFEHQHAWQPPFGHYDAEEGNENA